MSIEIRMIRTKSLGKRAEKFEKGFTPPIYAESTADLFSNLQKYVGQIPEKERVNCYYTLGHKREMASPSRSWSHQDVIPFDIDKIEYIDGSPNPKYAEIFFRVTGISPKKSVLVATGNGLQILVKPPNAITSSDYFTKNKLFYAALMDKVFDAYAAAGLPAEKDVSAFEPNRLFRLPETLNQKPDKPERMARILSGALETDENFDLIKASGLPNVTEDEQVPEREVKYSRIDTSAVEAGCEFLKWTKDEPDAVNEAEWYAMLSIVGRFDNGREKALEYSRGAASFSAHATEQKLDQALRASGPRTCENVNGLWSECHTCPNWKKIVSPVSLKGPNFIATRENGFHSLNKKGNKVPAHDDLYKYYVSLHPYVNVAGSHYLYNGTHFEVAHDDTLLAFAEAHFDPKPNQAVAGEFRAKIRRNHVENESFFGKFAEGKVNLLNGVLDTDTMQLTASSPGFGFFSVLPFKYDPIADAPLFRKFMRDVTCGDADLQEVLLEYMGYAVANSAPLAHKALMLVGEGANGKSTFVQILSALVGKGAVALSPAQYESGFDTFRLMGATLCITEEMDRYMKDSWFERFKSLVTGGDVTASLKGKDAVTFRSRAKYILTCNELPKGANPNMGYYRRLIIAPFNATFEEGKNLVRGIDRKIIENELPGILNVVLDAYQRLRAKNFKFADSAATAEALVAHKLDTDNVARWMSENIIKSPETSENSPREMPRGAPEWAVLDKDGVLCADNTLLYQSYVAWTGKQGEKPLSDKRFRTQFKLYVKSQAWGELPVRQVSHSKGKRALCTYGITFIDDSEY